MIDIEAYLTKRINEPFYINRLAKTKFEDNIEDPEIKISYKDAIRFLEEETTITPYPVTKASLTFMRFVINHKIDIMKFVMKAELERRRLWAEWRRRHRRNNENHKEAD